MLGQKCSKATFLGGTDWPNYCGQDALGSAVVMDHPEAVCLAGAPHREVLGVNTGERRCGTCCLPSVHMSEDRDLFNEGYRLRVQNGAVHLAGWLNSVGTEIGGLLKACRNLNVQGCRERCYICSPAPLGLWICDKTGETTHGGMGA